MGIGQWEETGPWHANAGESLRSLQRQRIAAEYDLPAIVADRLADACHAAEDTRRRFYPAGLKTHLLDAYEADVAFRTGLNARPLPTDLDGQLEIVRRVRGADDCGGVLDVSGVGGDGTMTPARLLSGPDLIEAFGTPTPTAGDRVRGRWTPGLGRGESACFPLYNAAGTPVGWRSSVVVRASPRDGRCTANGTPPTGV